MAVITAYKVLIASPADVDAERAACLRAIEEANEILDGTAVFQPIMWDQDISPGIASYPQQVVNEHVGDYEIFLGILWGRLGTPTPASASGTAEEYEIARARWAKAPESVQIWFFLSNKARGLREVDAEQLVAVESFRQRLSKDGVYSVEFATLDELSRHVRLALSRYARDHSRPDTSDSATGIASSDENEEDEWLDHLALAEEAMIDATQVTVSIGVEIEGLGDSIGERANELRDLPDADGSVSPRKMRAVINAAGADLNSYSRAMEVQVPAFAAAWSEYAERMTALLMTAYVQHETSRDDLEALKASAVELATTIEGALRGTARLQESVAENAGRTARFKAAKRRALGNLDRLMAAFQQAHAATTMVATNVSDLLAARE